jgi:hypothetical protein
MNQETRTSGMHSQKYPKTLVHPARAAVTVKSIAEEELFTGLLGFVPVKIPEFKSYPKMLSHPDHEPARMVSPEQHGPAVSADSPMAAAARLFSYVASVWEPERNPPVIAQNADEEATLIAQGYCVTGTPDAAAFSAAHASPGNPQGEIVQFPKWVTPPQGEPVLVKSVEEERKLLAQWSEKDGTKKRAERKDAA